MNGLTSSYVPDIPVDTVVTDSRQVTPGSVFVAIVGDNFDGNDYARQALDSGAAAAVVSRGSGEGMIRKYPEILETYSLSNIEELASIQKGLLEDAYTALKGEGILIRKGEIIRKVPEEQLLDTLREELQRWMK